MSHLSYSYYIGNSTSMASSMDGSTTALASHPTLLTSTNGPKNLAFVGHGQLHTNNTTNRIIQIPHHSYHQRHHTGRSPQLPITTNNSASISLAKRQVVCSSLNLSLGPKVECWDLRSREDLHLDPSFS
eukprot:4538210-Amphidinium_carterae.1